MQYRFDDQREPMGPFIRSPQDLPPREREVYDVLDLIVAEFDSDPNSVACFDLRVVLRAKAAVAPFRALKALRK